MPRPWSAVGHAPPAAITGTFDLRTDQGSSTMVETSRLFLKPPPSPPSTHQPVDARLDRLQGRAQRTAPRGRPSGRPPSRRVVVLVGIAGRGGDEPHALVDARRRRCRDRARRPGRCSPRTACRSGRASCGPPRARRRARRTRSSMIPRPPAFGRPPRPACGAGDPPHGRFWTMGYSTPSICVIRVLISDGRFLKRLFERMGGAWPPPAAVPRQERTLRESPRKLFGESFLHVALWFGCTWSPEAMPASRSRRPCPAC